MLKKIIWTFCFLSFLTGFCTMMPAPGSKPQTGDQDNRAWIGSILIEHTASQAYEIDNSTKFRKKTRNKNHTLTDTVSIILCVKKDGKSCIINVERSFGEKFEERSFVQDDREICPLTEEQMKHSFLYRAAHFKQEVKKPGDSREISTTYDRSLYSELDEPSLKDQTEAGLIFFPSGDYYLGANNDVYVNYTYDTTDEIHHVCSGKKRIVETHITTGKIGDEPRASIVESGEGEDSHTVFNSVQPPLTKTLTCIAQGKVEGNRISGSKIMWETKAKKATDRKEKCVAHWEFTYAEPMKFMVECLIFTEEKLDRDLQSCFKELNLPDGACDRAKLVECFIDNYKNDIPPLVPRTDCIDDWCGYTGNENPSPELRKALYDCISRALFEYEKRIEECNMYGGCDTCKD